MLEIRAPSGHLTKQTAEPHLKLLFLYGSGLILTYNHLIWHTDQISHIQGPIARP